MNRPAENETIDGRLDNFDPAARRECLSELLRLRGAELPPRSATRPIANMHAHSFFSYNSYGYSPARFAWLARKAGLEAAGIVDFDVLDGLNEFTEAGRLLGLKTCVGVESRVFVPEFADKVINSPGEPGISYHMGVGFVRSGLSAEAVAFLNAMRGSAENRNRSLVRRVNAHTKPVELDYDADVLPLTPSGNATERHICLAYARKAATVFEDRATLLSYWSDRLEEPADRISLPASPSLQNTIRARTMKQGGVGYVLPDKGSFPQMADMNRFVLAAGAIPTVTWLDGTSPAERDMRRVLETAMATGAAALNIIPDRNFKPGVKDERLRNLYDVVELAKEYGLPIIAGTEMNSPGQKFVDDFDSAELAPLREVFITGARIVCAHSALQGRAGIGYLGEWSRSRFETVKEKNIFFAEVGRLMDPSKEDAIPSDARSMPPRAILDALRAVSK